MTTRILVSTLIIVSLLFVWKNSFSTFFTQDDFILINEFSGGDLVSDLKNAWGKPKVTHWRPMHSFYFLTSGNLFAKNFVNYHILTFCLYLSVMFFIYKVTWILSKNRNAACLSSFFYGTNSSHFVSLYWISGNATTLGFLFFIISFYFYIRRKTIPAGLFFITSFLASEAMVVGVLIYFIWEFMPKKSVNKFNLVFFSVLSIFFVIIRYFLFTPKITFEFYRLSLSSETFTVFRYYLLRILDFAEVSGDTAATTILVFLLAAFMLFLFKNLKRSTDMNLILFYFFVCIIGLFPFLLIPAHASPHYMNISIWGFSTIVSIVVARQNPKVIFLFCTLFLAVSFLNVRSIERENWVVNKSEISKYYIGQIEKVYPPSGSLLIFRDNDFSTSEETYIALGTGEAFAFWFKDRNYEGCFSFYQECVNGVTSFEIN